jgi:hypothetical protein
MFALQSSNGLSGARLFLSSVEDYRGKIFILSLPETNLLTRKFFYIFAGNFNAHFSFVFASFRDERERKLALNLRSFHEVNIYADKTVFFYSERVD